MRFTVHITAVLPEKDFTRVDHLETVTVDHPEQLDLVVPRLLMAVGQSGIVQKTCDHGWKLIPAQSLSRIRASIVPARPADPGSSQ